MTQMTVNSAGSLGAGAPGSSLKEKTGTKYRSSGWIKKVSQELVPTSNAFILLDQDGEANSVHGPATIKKLAAKP